ncbi:MAG: HlyD family secretion protein, partial [Bryobacteraceae bacterium]
MKRKWKIILGIFVILVIAAGSLAAYRYSKRGIVTVQSGRARRQDLTALVTASGEIKPRNYINIGTNAVSPSRIVELLVTEGQKVKRGQLLARLESVQPEAEVAAQRANLSATESESAASEASLNAADDSIRTARASVDRARAELERARISFSRTELLWNEKLIARQEFDQRKAERDALEAALR